MIARHRIFPQEKWEQSPWQACLLLYLAHFFCCFWQILVISKQRGMERRWCIEIQRKSLYQTQCQTQGYVGKQTGPKAAS